MTSVASPSPASASDFVDVELFCEEWVVVGGGGDSVSSSNVQNRRDQSSVVHVCEFTLGKSSLFHSGPPFFDEWERVYAGEASLRRDERRKRDPAKAVVPTVVPSPVSSKAVAKAKPLSSVVVGPAMSKTRDDSKVEEVRQRAAQMKAETEAMRARLHDFEQQRKNDPFKAAKMLESEERKREREEASAAADGVVASSGEKKHKAEEPLVTGDISMLKAGFADIIMRTLKPHLVAGRIADRDSFKHLTRKLTKELVKKELARGNSLWHPKFAAPAEEYASAFMARLQAKSGVYKK